ncbi:MAG: hypothetical protein U0Z75_09265 [Deinococcaceae bacterium]
MTALPLDRDMLRSKLAYISGIQERLEAVASVLCIVFLQVTLDPALTLWSARWFVGFEGIVLLILVGTSGRSGVGRSSLRILCALLLIALIAVSNLTSLGLLTEQLLHSVKTLGRDVLVEAIKIWLTHVFLFALCYWEMDRGGASRRSGLQNVDFLFPQMASPQWAPKHWKPSFMDYLFLSFTNATAFSPTDTLPLTPRAKCLMLVQAAASLLTLALVIARAVNTLS